MNSRNVKSCFVVSPIGQEESTIRERSNKILKYVVRPVCQEMGYNANRIDEMPNSFLISKKIIECLLTSDLVIADLTDNNPNVFYELAIRHFVGKPIIHIMEQEQNHKIPFDLKDCNIIFIDHKDIESVERCKITLKNLIKHVELEEIVDNPITNVLKQMNIDVATLSKSRKNILHQFEDLSKIIINEINLSRSENRLLIEKIISDRNIDQDINNKKIINGRISSINDFSGKWNSDNGLVKLVQNHIDIFGEYQWGSKWVGYIIGKISNNKIIFHWNRKDIALEGFGYWQIINNKQLEGGWGYLSGKISYSDLIENSDLISKLKIVEYWDLLKET